MRPLGGRVRLPALLTRGPPSPLSSALWPADCEQEAGRQCHAENDSGSGLTPIQAAAWAAAEGAVAGAVAGPLVGLATGALAAAVAAAPVTAASLPGLSDSAQADAGTERG